MVKSSWNRGSFQYITTDIHIYRTSLHLVDVYSSVLTPVWTLIESMHSGWELLSHGTGSAASCSAHTCFNEESDLYTFCFLSCELSLTHKNSHPSTLNCMPQLKPQLWHIFLVFCNIPIFSFVPYLFSFHPLPSIFSTMSSCFSLQLLFVSR